MKKIEILWTGGWDSTFRIVELSRERCEVQPYYIIDNNRISMEHELKAMKTILEVLKSKNQTKAIFNEIIMINKNEIQENKEISNAYKVIASKTHLGAQHDWLARFALHHKNIEIGTEAGTIENSHILQSIHEFGNLIFKDGIGYLDENSSKEGLLVLGNFSFPIIDKTELDMVKLIKEWGYEDVMKNIWFCHAPIRGKCCGMCHPCELKYESNMEFLLPKSAIRNYKIHHFFKKFLKETTTNKMVYLYRKLSKGKEK